MSLRTALVLVHSTMILAGIANADAASIRTGTSPKVALAEQSHTGWQNICRERIIIRRDRDGRLVTFQAPSCSLVWISKRYYANGTYYADQTLLQPIY
ncbi:hypothetical protein [Ancylobacter pratisalsi]|uniref:Uncharacterized protein n=1 Tax=Ancylobacter pratisalsi TaxID=1745854 RepID=A0A6P1YQY2_9HYPH|nr:hypothetical protein [Ancylobacter pratisalsi]QIB35897.1 hypothetical protein G3A50_20925 [Ancylobacter pratisalsi]